MRAESSVMRFMEFVVSELEDGRHPLSCVFRGAPPTSDRSTRLADGKPSTRRPVTREDVDLAADLRQRGEPWTEIESRVGLSRPALIKFARKHDHPLVRLTKPKTNHDLRTN